MSAADRRKYRRPHIADEGRDYDDRDAEITRLRHDIERHIAIASEHATECERLRAELAECKRDAERYRWLRSESCPWPGVFSIEGADDYGWYAICEGDLDQAIDDALAAKEKVK